MLHLFSDPTFVIATAFFGFFAVLIYLKVPGMVGRSLDGRADKIKSDIEQAELLCKEAQDLLSTYQKKQREAVKEAENIVNHAKEEAERMLVEGKTQLDAALKRREQMVSLRIKQAEIAATDEIRDETARLAVKATETILRNNLSAKQGTAILNQSIDNLGGQLH